MVCEVVRSEKGLQAVRICSMDDSTAIHPSQLPQRTHVVVVPESNWIVHIETLRRCGFTELRPDQTILVHYGRGPNGLIAVELKPDNVPGPSSH